jgi:L-lactate dehydrogenase complex protein LldG
MNRADFLARVRDATGRNPKAPITRPPAPPTLNPNQDARTLAERFKLENERVLGQVHLVNSLQEARESLKVLLVDKTSFVSSSHEILQEFSLEKNGLELVAAKDADVGITGADFAVAATGSVALSSSFGRLATLLPFHHIIILKASQILPDLEDLYAKLESLELPSAWGMHTGPSKSADIEQTMALGVHGPGKVDVIVILGS